MPDFFRDFSPRALQQWGIALLDASKRKMPEHFKPSAKMSEGYQYLSGEIEDKSKLYYGTYCNELYDVWKGWAPKFCSRPPNYMVRPGSREDQGLADACQELFRYRVNRFDYQQMILQTCQDAVILGVGYARHQWDERRGLTTTSRFKPQNVFWDATAKTISGAGHVIEKHTMPRWQFIQKFGRDVGKDIPVTSENGEEAGYWPAENAWLHEGKGPDDPIEFYQLWVVRGDFRRIYYFHDGWAEDYLQPASRKANENVGEEWPFDFDEGEWHLTPLIPTMLNDRIEGIAMWEVVRGQYLSYQSLLGASIKQALQSCKKPIVCPEPMRRMVDQIQATGETMFTVVYSKEMMDEFAGRKINELIHVLDLGEADPDLMAQVKYHQERFQQLSGSSAVAQIQPGGVETAAEATKLADAAANRVADDQGAVERWTTKIGRKELCSDLRHIPREDVCKWRMPEDAEYEDSPEGFGEDPGTAYGAKYLRKVPRADSILLKKGPASDKAALKMEASREKKRNQAFVGRLVGDPQFQEMQPEQAEQEVPVTPEVDARMRYGVPILAEVEICNPGIAHFVPEENAGAWPERAMIREEVEKMFAVSIETGTSSMNGKMARVQEVGMIAKTLLPMFQERGLNKQAAAMMNAVTKSAELQALDDCVVTQQELDAADAKAAEQAQQAAMMEAQAKQQPGDNPETVKMQSDAEMAKAQASVLTSREKTTQIDKKNEGDAARRRDKNIAQQQMMAMNRLNGVA